MKLVTFRKDEKSGVGRLEGEKILPLSGIDTMQQLITSWAHDIEVEKDIQDSIPLSEVRLEAPIHPVRNMICVGWNYLDHVNEGHGKREGQDIKELPKLPTLFTKATTCINDPYGEVPLHQGTTEKLDWEAELAVVIGRSGSNISEQDALSHVFGYCVANDVTGRDVMRAHGGQWFKGKSLDGSCPLGPVIVTADEIADPQCLEITCRVNGEIKQQSNTRHQIFPVTRLIAEISKGMTLIPGDLILTGTPEGVGFARNPPEFLRAGDLLETEVSGIGVLRNRIGSE